MTVEYRLMLLVYPNDLLVQQLVSMYGLCLGSLHCFMELGCNSLVSGCSIICLSYPSSELGCEALLDFLQFQV